MVMFSQTTPLVEDAYTLLVETARSDGAFRKRVDQSVERILEAKKKIEFAPIRNRANVRARLTRQIDRLKQSNPTVEKVHVR
jgi:hypothetical protein